MERKFFLEKILDLLLLCRLLLTTLLRGFLLLCHSNHLLFNDVDRLTRSSYTHSIT